MSIVIEPPPPQVSVDDGGESGATSYAADVFRLATAIRSTDALPRLIAEAEQTAATFDGPLEHAVSLHVDSSDTREIASSLQLLQLCFDTTAVLIRYQYEQQLTFDDVARALDDPEARLLLTGDELGSWVWNFTTNLGQHVTSEQIFSFIVVLSATLVLVVAVVMEPPVIVVAAVLAGLDAVNRFRLALRDPVRRPSSFRLPEAASAIGLQAGPPQVFVLVIGGRVDSRAAFVRYLRKSADWLPIDRKAVRSEPTGVPDRAVVTLRCAGGLTDDQRHKIVTLADSMLLSTSWI